MWTNGQDTELLLVCFSEETVQSKFLTKEIGSSIPLMRSVICLVLCVYLLLIFKGGGSKKNFPSFEKKLFSFKGSWEMPGAIALMAAARNHNDDNTALMRATERQSNKSLILQEWLMLQGTLLLPLSKIDYCCFLKWDLGTRASWRAVVRHFAKYCTEELPELFVNTAGINFVKRF